MMPIVQAVIIVLYIVVAVCFSISLYFTVFWFRRSLWTRLQGEVVGHEYGGCAYEFCENAVIEVITDEESHRFTSLVASCPPMKLGTRVSVLRSPATGEFVELSFSGVMMPTLGPLIAGVVILWLAIHTS